MHLQKGVAMLSKNPAGNDSPYQAVDVCLDGKHILAQLFPATLGKMLNYIEPTFTTCEKCGQERTMNVNYGAKADT